MDLCGELLAEGRKECAGQFVLSPEIEMDVLKKIVPACDSRRRILIERPLHIDQVHAAAGFRTGNAADDFVDSCIGPEAEQIEIAGTGKRFCSKLGFARGKLAATEQIVEQGVFWFGCETFLKRRNPASRIFFCFSSITRCDLFGQSLRLPLLLPTAGTGGGKRGAVF